MNWNDWQNWLQIDEKTTELYQKSGNINEVKLPDKYLSLWKEISLPVQTQKALNHNLTQEEAEKCFVQLSRRPYYLVSLAEKFGVKNIVEVGTAEGLQYFSFAEYASNNGGHVWSCDLRDVRNEACKERYSDVTTFCLGDSSKLSSILDEKIDLFYIDASHHRNMVWQDVKNIREHQSDNPLWVFDDFDARFGCYLDIQEICKSAKRFKIYKVGNAASGNPNHQVIVYGKL